MSNIDYKALSEYWSKKWHDEGIYRTDVMSSKKKLYLLVEFPYPSGEGLHVGHVRSYTAMDVIARMKRREGYEVLFPMGYDSFGLPAENYAIKTGVHPSITTRKNIDNFTRQMKDCGFSFDWERVFETTDLAYYKWTQWIFLKLYEKGLAYKKEMPVNWCPKDKCVLANEEVIDGKCERCGTQTEKKNKEQWMLAITKYAERLDKDLDDTTYLEKIKIQQRNWIGLSEGSEIDFKIKAEKSDSGFDLQFTIFTTRADTIFGCTYCVLAPEHPLVTELLSKNIITNSDEVSTYKENARLKTDIDRSAEGKEKTGVKLEGVTAVNPANNEEVPVFIADYVLPQYGTGAIMAVPAHDERDYQFAKKYNIAIKEVIAPRTVLSGDDSVRPGIETLYRTVVDVILENDKGEFLLVTENKKDIHFIGGGVEVGDSELETIHKETEEESGYADIEIYGEGFSPTSVVGFRHTKQKNQDTVGFFYHAKLKSDKKVPSEVEEGKHEIGWFKKEDVAGMITWPHHKEAWLTFLDGRKKLFTNDGLLINSSSYTRLVSEDARRKITKDLGGKIVIKSKLRDWVFARQRYWGEPIPVVYDETGKMYPVAESELPIVLPMVDKYEPTDNGESPLAVISDWVNVKGAIDSTGHFVSGENGVMFRRETDTMPQWAGSSWYFMRYIDPKNDQAIGDKELLAKWLPVDWYNGGMEHTTLHLLYSRFWYKLLFDIGIVPTSEPYYKRTSQGMILGAGGVKMSKSLGNVVNPDKIIEQHGADVLRVYEMFVGPFDQSVAWDDKAIVGVSRFLDKVEKVAENVKDGVPSLPIIHQSIEKVTKDIGQMAFNTAISQLMICVNEFEKRDEISRGDYEMFLQILAPFAPFITEELWKNLGNSTSIHTSDWPVADVSLLVEADVTYAVQITGKLRGTVVLPRDLSEDEVLARLKKSEIYTKYVGDSEPKKVIFVQNRLVNVVI